MGALHWSKNYQLNQYCHSPPYYEWAMNKVSPNLQQDQDQDQDQNQERRKKQKGEALQSIDQEEPEPELARCEWDFNLSTVVSPPISSGVGGISPSDALGVTEFDPSDTILATAGIARKIRIYNINKLLSQFNDDVIHLDNTSACDHYICAPAKLSSLKWRPGTGGRVFGSGDYDGVVTEYDLESRVPIFERDEHGGRRVWSMDYSHYDPILGASASDDGTMQMWDQRCDDGECVAKVRPSKGPNVTPVCCVEFNPFGSALVAVGCADCKAYTYDVRKMVDPVHVFEGHTKTVTYVRFLDEFNVVSAGADGCLKLWNVNDMHVIRTFRGHVNNRSFVGLSLWRHGGLVGCGSENNQVFVYDKRWGEPIWVHGFDSVGLDRGFVSSVCWRQVGEDQCTLVAGASSGVLQVFMGRRR
ncbi:hypothetical protein ACFE04_027162 [Oxalis oulophora]